jgi:hypothetical protein
MNVHINKAGHQGFTGGIDDIGVKGAGIGWSGSEDLRDFTVLNENSAVGENAAVPDKNTDMLEQD